MRLELWQYSAKHALDPYLKTPAALTKESRHVVCEQAGAGAACTFCLYRAAAGSRPLPPVQRCCSNLFVIIKHVLEAKINIRYGSIQAVFETLGGLSKLMVLAYVLVTASAYGAMLKLTTPIPCST
ncbi:hypothetical protein V6N13_084088 [Hibiscus sabdariffa]|uniref:Uncharacterized protein n=1 Tax=Hibiscus sabdariffa TaxID=183260 RepID=A0ABR2T0K0_9ROSI